MAVVVPRSHGLTERGPFSSSVDPRDVLPDSQTYPDIDHITERDTLIVSPYTEEQHLLRLSTVDPQSQILAKALTQMEVLRPDYATASYADTFNWPEIVDEVRKLSRNAHIQWKHQRFYVVVFRSRIPPTTNYGDLGALDKAAHAEATASGGFLKYWFGAPDEEGRNMATCLWCSRTDAIQGGIGPAHRKAAGAARHMYTEWAIEKLALTLEEGVKNWSLSTWQDDE